MFFRQAQQTGDTMNLKLGKYLGFPYPPQYEAEYNRHLMRQMHKPLLVAVVATLLFVAWLVGVCVFWPDAIAPPAYIQGLLVIHFSFMVFTIIVLLLVIGLRRQLFQYPGIHVALCNAYAIGVCLWGNVLSAYASYSVAVYMAFITVTICVSMVSLFKPWLAVLVFTVHYFLYVFLTYRLATTTVSDLAMRLFSAALVAALATIIAIAFYRFRTRTFYDRQLIAQHLEKIHQVNHQLQQLIHIDNLTGFFNRRFYDEALPARLDGLAQGGGYCCIMLDIDFFKRYNDHYGHQAGDGCLRNVASFIRGPLPDASFPVRYGGEEFMVLAQVASAKAALALAEAVRVAVEQAHIIHASSPFGKVTLSCGLVFCPQHERPGLAALTRQADEALYRSKQSGRNRTTLTTVSTQTFLSETV